jgi:hypothetical protein
VNAVTCGRGPLNVLYAFFFNVLSQGIAMVTGRRRVIAEQCGK